MPSREFVVHTEPAASQPLPVLDHFFVYDDPHDLIGPLQNAVHPQVTHVPLNGVVLQKGGKGGRASSMSFTCGALLEWRSATTINAAEVRNQMQ